MQSLIKEQSARGQDAGVVQLHVIPQSSCAIPDALYMLDDRTCPLLHHHQFLRQQQQQQSGPRQSASSSTVDIIGGSIPGQCCCFKLVLSLLPDLYIYLVYLCRVSGVRGFYMVTGKLNGQRQG